MTYKGLAVDVRQVGRELGVRYVVQGSARLAGLQLRVSAQLLDTATGAHRWTDSFEEPFAGFADLTRTLASRIAETLGNTLIWIEADRARASRAQDPTTVDLLLRGRVLLGLAPTPENVLEAHRLFGGALLLDDGSAEAHGYMGITLVTMWTHNLDADREGLLRRAEEHAGRAVELNPWHARGHFLRGMIHQSRRRFDQALAEYDTALALWPNHPSYHARRGWVRNLTDSPAEALADLAQAVRISPRDPWIGTTYVGMAFANLMLGRDAEAVGHAVRAVAGNPGFPLVRLQLASALALAGRMEEARIALDEHHRMSPGMTVELFRRRARENSGHPLYLATCEREAEALRAIGMPEE